MTFRNLQNEIWCLNSPTYTDRNPFFLKNYLAKSISVLNKGVTNNQCLSPPPGFNIDMMHGIKLI